MLKLQLVDNIITVINGKGVKQSRAILIENNKNLSFNLIHFINDFLDIYF